VFKITTQSAGFGCCRIHYARAPCAPPPPGWIFSSLSPKQIYDASPADSRRQLGLSRADRGRRTHTQPRAISATRQNKTQIAKYFMSLDTQAAGLPYFLSYQSILCAFARDVSRVCIQLVVVATVRLFAAVAQFFRTLSHESYSIFYADNSVGQRAGCWLGGAARRGVSTNKKWRVLYIQKWHRKKYCWLCDFKSAADATTILHMEDQIAHQLSAYI
jgi:hypothetical protein